ncbi:hypothetical protein DOTSEDRAFT_41120 [Dothistroma septosporum NZE10]|uniref:Uncharacterized protein n=1 Tax=Dothistroma septosporum (strain NZE10 / CBS 128990) TaxID=675120 RepID=N1Q536_DOTSN|nr:hypothetical protein DOTSEDRAFT_41120 [Dothistroma septosporum NZE10]
MLPESDPAVLLMLRRWQQEWLGKVQPLDFIWQLLDATGAKGDSARIGILLEGGHDDIFDVNVFACMHPEQQSGRICTRTEGGEALISLEPRLRQLLTAALEWTLELFDRCE